MITGKDIYDVLAAIIPLYVAMILAYGSVKWWKIFTPDQCSGINRFVAVFAVPLLGFHFISTNDIYAMNYHFIAADSLQKVVILAALFLWHSFSKNGSLEWLITLFSLSTLPNTLVMGIPLLRAMYGDFSGNLMVQISKKLLKHQETPPSCQRKSFSISTCLPETVSASIVHQTEIQNHQKWSHVPPPPPARVQHTLHRNVLLDVWSLVVVSVRPPDVSCTVVHGNDNGYTEKGSVGSHQEFRQNYGKLPLGYLSMLSLKCYAKSKNAGLFMALQPKIIACGKSVATFSMAVRFLTGPAVIAATSIAIGLRGVLLHVAIVQAALPQGIVPFVFAKEYNVHPDILSTAVIFGMLIALPITILYYVLLGV
ncbi:auxin efflux carrier component 2-like [Olea europaea var. sylvestris]|uniref:auxin efflux carrier component 2-like n=1 Tax=Olea europaea var. sylvestris TaxID=158386 RepID=UPI000C1CDA0F|nr:auxin efflux carrier component 2-like [Olea europaea var. sylvestris]